MSRPKTKPPAARQDPLSRKLRPRRVYRMQIAEPTVEQRQALTAAQYEMRMALALNDDDRQRTAREQFDLAEASIEGCWQSIVLHNVHPDRFPVLVSEHPPTKDQAADGAEYNLDTFRPALIAECATEAGMTAEQWAEELSSDRWSDGERREIFDLAVSVNVTGGYR